jgi:hypothetical protein
MEPTTLEKAKRLKANLEELRKRIKAAGFPCDEAIHFGHMIGAIGCDAQMIIEDLEKENTNG